MTSKRPTKVKSVETTRDMEIVRFIYACGWLNTTHIVKVMFPTQPYKRKVDGVVQEFQPELPYQLWSASAMRRLIFLRSKGYIKSSTPLIEAGHGKDPDIHYVGKLSYEKEWVEGPLLPPPEVWSRYYRHEKAIRDVFTDMLCAARITGKRVPTFKSTRTLKAEYSDYIPDWYMSLRLDAGNPYHIFLEIDRAEENERQWKNKIDAIGNYGASPIYEELYGNHRFRFATITTSDKRLEAMRRWSEEMGCGRKYWFTTFDKLTPLTALQEPIWSICGRSGLDIFTNIR